MEKISNPAAMSGVRFRNAVEEFEDAQREYIGFGASDTEPRAVFADVLESVIKGYDKAVPTTARAWQLFSDKPGVGDAVEALNAAMSNVVEQARINPHAARVYFYRRYGYVPR